MVRAQGPEEQQLLLGTIDLPGRIRTRYTYEVGKRRYTGSRIYFGDELVPGPESRPPAAEESRVGSEIVVHYNPRNPDDAVIQTRPHPRLSRVVALGLTLCSLAPLLGWLERHESVLRGTPVDFVAVGFAGISLLWLTARR